jgi:hypothetical protein
MTFAQTPIQRQVAVTRKQNLDIAAILSSENGEVDKLRQHTLRERGVLLAMACRDAARIEASRLKMGMPPTRPAPWPQSTWDFLAECARRVRDQ